MKKRGATTPTESVESSGTGIEEEGQDVRTVRLKREVGLVRGVSLVIGAMIGSGIFISPKGVLVGANSVGMSLVIWVVCAVASCLGITYPLV